MAGSNRRHRDAWFVGMCLIAVAWQAHPRWRLVLASNRDEFHARPATALARWTDAPGIVGGRDGLHGGSWLAMRGMRLAAVTNVRIVEPRGERSRGALVADFIAGDLDVADAIDALEADASAYRPFNLLLHDGDTLAYASNTPLFSQVALAPGVHGLSNGALDAPWPKVVLLKDAMRGWLATQASSPVPTDRAHAPDVDALFAALSNSDVAPDAQLPRTGVGMEVERMLSPAFITGATYGTRASTVVLVADDHAWMIERRFGPGGVTLGEARVRIDREGGVLARS